MKDDTLAKETVQELRTNTNMNWTLSKLDNQDNFVLFHNGSMYIPDDLELRRRIVSQFHDGPISGHPGISETTTQVQREYYWPGMRSFIRHYINGCGICQQFKYIRRRNTPSLIPIPSTSDLNSSSKRILLAWNAKFYPTLY